MCAPYMVGNWTLFQQYCHPWHQWREENGEEQNAMLEAKWYCPKEKWRLPPLQAGDIVDCRGKVVSGGNTGGLGLTFVAWAQGDKGVAAPQLANFAIVALPSGELTWAKLAGRDEGYISRSLPMRTATNEHLEVYRAMLPEFLGESTASSVNSLLMRTPDPNVADPAAGQAAAKERAARERRLRRDLTQLQLRRQRQRRRRHARRCQRRRRHARRCQRRRRWQRRRRHARRWQQPSRSPWVSPSPATACTHCHRGAAPRTDARHEVVPQEAACAAAAGPVPGQRHRIRRSDDGTYGNPNSNPNPNPISLCPNANPMS